MADATAHLGRSGRRLSARPARAGRVLVALMTVLALLGISAGVALQAPIVSTKVGNPPTTGGMRPGPLGLNPPPVLRNKGVRPVAIQIDKAQVDAEVETIHIVDGVMQNPTGPWVVSWYAETAKLGQTGNVVMAGHVDYWNVGPSVFRYVGQLQPGDLIRVTGEDGTVYTYAVKYTELVTTANLTSDKIQEIVYPPRIKETLTLITCGGEFDYASGEYLSRMVIRAERVQS